MESNINNNQQQQISEGGAASPRLVDESYRLARKKYMCHVCEREFTKMSPVLELVDVECPRCQQNFCEEINSQPNSQVASPRANVQQAPAQSSPQPNRSGPASPAMPATQPSSANQESAGVEELLGSLLGFGRLFSQRREAPSSAT